MGHLVQEQRLPADIHERFFPENRLGHSRERGEFIDHPAQVADLADDRFGKALKGAVAPLELLAVAALQSLRRQLNRRQRILDFMRDPPRHVRPGGAALIEQLLRDVVERQHLTLFVARYLHRQRLGLAVRRDLDDRLACIAIEQRIELRRKRGKRLAHRVAAGNVQHGRCRAVDELNAPIAADRDHAGRHAGHHRLDQRPAAVQRGRLRLQPLGHHVKRAAQRTDFVPSAGFRHAHRQITLGNLSRRADQLVDRPDQTIGDRKRDPHRQPDDENRDRKQHCVEFQLQ